MSGQGDLTVLNLLPVLPLRTPLCREQGEECEGLERQRGHTLIFQEANEQGLNRRIERLTAPRAQSGSHIGTEILLRDWEAKAEVDGGRRIGLFQMWEMALTEPAKGPRDWHRRAS